MKSCSVIQATPSSIRDRWIVSDKQSKVVIPIGYSTVIRSTIHSDMKIIHALPRRMRFEAKAASSVELCVAEWISGSRYRETTTVFAEHGDTPLLDVEIFRLAPVRRLLSWHLAYTIRQQVRRRGYDLVVSQQHIPTVARIAALSPNTPVVLQTHNFIEPPLTGLRYQWQNAVRYRQFQRLAGITLVSEATRKQFESDWPTVTVPRTVISNGFDFSLWKPAAERQKTILVVGRAHDTKGILEAAQGVRMFLGDYIDWRAVFILTDTVNNKTYLDSIVEALKPVNGRIEILIGVPFARVKHITENAAISIVASKWAEPFGRTALEAHAGGAALISSQSGGLIEISGDAAASLPEISGPAIAVELSRLASNEPLRQRLATAGMERVRRLFPLTRASAESLGDVMPICERLDQFYDDVLGRSAPGPQTKGIRYTRAL